MSAGRCSLWRVRREASGEDARKSPPSTRMCPCGLVEVRKQANLELRFELAQHLGGADGCLEGVQGHLDASLVDLEVLSQLRLGLEIRGWRDNEGGICRG